MRGPDARDQEEEHRDGGSQKQVGVRAAQKRQHQARRRQREEGEAEVRAQHPCVEEPEVGNDAAAAARRVGAARVGAGERRERVREERPHVDDETRVTDHEDDRAHHVGGEDLPVEQSPGESLVAVAEPVGERDRHHRPDRHDLRHDRETEDHPE